MRHAMRGLCIFCFLLVRSTKLTIAHTNDVHARISQSEVTGGYNGCKDPSSAFNASLHSKYFTGCHGGAARRKTKLDELRASSENFLLLDAGDEFQGTLWYNIYQGWATAYVMNIMGYDAISFGNHEFDSGESVLSGYLNLLDDSIQVLGANIEADSQSLISGKFNSSHIFQLNSATIGVVGYVIEETPSLSNPGPHLHFDDVLNSIQLEVNKLREKNVDLIIGVGHVGWLKDQEIAEKISGIDVVIGGHTDTFCYTGNPLDQSSFAFPSTAACDYPTQITGVGGKKVCIAQAFTYGTWLGRMEVEFDENGVISCGGNPIFLSGETVEQDADVLNWTMRHWEAIEDSYDHVVGQTRFGASGQKCVMRKGNDAALGNMFTDALIQLTAKYVDDTVPTPLIGMYNGGGLRADLPVGDVSMGDIMVICPFGNDIVTLKSVPGYIILEALEHGVSKVEEESGQFGHWSGVRFEYDPNLPAGRRVVSAEILCYGCEEELALVDLFTFLNRTWDVVTGAYLAMGGDSYSMFTPYYNGVGGSFVDYDIFIQYFEDFGPTMPICDGRIRVINTSSTHHVCGDLSPYCSDLSTKCQNDGSVTLSDGSILPNCYGTCGSCPWSAAGSYSSESKCNDAGLEVAFILTTVFLASIILCMLFYICRDKGFRNQFEIQQSPYSNGYSQMRS